MISLPKRKLELLRTVMRFGPIHISAIISKSAINPTMAVTYTNEFVNAGILKKAETGTNIKMVDMNYDSDLALHLVSGIALMEREDFIKRHPDIKLLFRKIQETKDVSFALVFGSYARGTESPESDVDLLVVSGRSRLSEEKFGAELNLVENKEVSFTFDTESEFARKKKSAIYASMRRAFIIVKNPMEYLLAAI